MRRLLWSIVGTSFILAVALTDHARGFVDADTLGDTTAEGVTYGYAGPQEDLAKTIEALSGPRPILAPSGLPLRIGHVPRRNAPGGSSRGDPPRLEPGPNDQSQVQLFVTGDADVVMRVRYLGRGISSNSAVLGVYHYPQSAGLGAAGVSGEALITQPSDPPGTVKTFALPRDSYVGLYANHHSSGQSYFTEHDRNDGEDHFLLFETNQGWLVALEDLNGLGDTDYEDLLALITFSIDGDEIDPGPDGPLGVIEIPADGSSVSGVGIFSGWICQGDVVEIEIDGIERSRAGSGTPRGDTEAVCDRTDTGFSSSINFNRLGDGEHHAKLIVDGSVLDEIDFEVVTLGEKPFLRGLNAVCEVPDFPSGGSRTTLRWSQGTQGFEIVGVE